MLKDYINRCTGLYVSENSNCTATRPQCLGGLCVSSEYAEATSSRHTLTYIGLSVQPFRGCSYRGRNSSIPLNFKTDQASLFYTVDQIWNARNIIFVNININKILYFPKSLTHDFVEFIKCDIHQPFRWL